MSASGASSPSQDRSDSTPAPTKHSDGLVRALRRLYRHFSQRRRVQLALVGTLTLLGAFAELVTIGAVLPFLALMADPAAAVNLPVIGDLIVRIGWTGGDLLLAASLGFGALAMAAASIRLLLAWVSQKYVYRLGHDIGMEVYRRTLYQPYPYHIARNSSALIADIEKVEAVVRSLLMPLMYAVTSTVIVGFILVALFSVDVRVAFLAIGGFGTLYLIVSFTMRRRLRANSKVIALARTERIKTVQEGLGGIRDVLLDRAQSVYLRKFEQLDSAYRDAQTANAFIGAAPRYLLEASGMILIAGMALVLARGPGGLADALPVLGALALGAQRLLPLLQLMYNGWAQVAGNRHNLLDVLSALEQPLTAAERGDAQGRPLAFEHAITLEKVDFRYGPRTPYVLRDLDLTIPKGSRVGIVGKTGSGKSTLMDLIMGLLLPTNGTVKIDGVVLTHDNVTGWQTRIAHVPQTIYLSDGSIAENIAFAISPDKVDRERIREVARQAAIDDFIESLPASYDTVVGEHGVRLSGGQRQRVAIARALYRAADVLVFDEATSALDGETETTVMKAITELGRELSILIVTHRVTTLQGCDIIVDLESGSRE